MRAAIGNGRKLTIPLGLEDQGLFHNVNPSFRLTCERFYLQCTASSGFSFAANCAKGNRVASSPAAKQKTQLPA
jgi:hypothetical protein